MSKRAKPAPIAVRADCRNPNRSRCTDGRERAPGRIGFQRLANAPRTVAACSRRRPHLPALAALPGCDLQENADTQDGRQLFIENCGTCHALDRGRHPGGHRAQPRRRLPPGTPRRDGPGQIEGVVTTQIENPRVTDPDNPALHAADDPRRPGGRRRRRQRRQRRGPPGIKPPIPADALQAPRSSSHYGCSSCHTPAAANATGAVGPNLDETLPGMVPSQIEQSIVDPNAQLAQGFGANIMPETYEQDLTPAGAQRPGRLPQQLGGQAAVGAKTRPAASASRSTMTCVIGRSIRSRAFSTTPRSSQRERSGGCVEDHSSALESAAARPRRRRWGRSRRPSPGPRAPRPRSRRSSARGARRRPHRPGRCRTPSA